MDLEFTRGDTQILKLQIKDLDGNILKLTENDELYFTLKQNANSEEVLLQKTLKNNGINLKEDNFYYITLKPEDTSNLGYGTYTYDIEVKSNDFVKTLILATITLTEEVTWKGDEV